MLSKKPMICIIVAARVHGVYLLRKCTIYPAMSKIPLAGMQEFSVVNYPI